MNKVLLVLADGMRPDSLAACGHTYIEPFLQDSRFTLAARTVFPSVTLPSHMSLFHSVDPDRHGILSNLYVPQVRPVRGLCEVLTAAGKTCSVFYDWEELRDVWRPGSVRRAFFDSGRQSGWAVSAARQLEQALAHIRQDDPDFTFLYIAMTDHAGHDHGWMGEEYLASVRAAWDEIRRLRTELPDHQMIVMADHGGHGRGHGTDLPEDMTIPIACNGSAFTPGPLPDDANIKDVAPTVAALLGVPADPEWEGKSLV